MVHVLAEHGARTRADHDELSDHLESVWSQLDFDANWLSAVERVEAESALERFVTWQEAQADLELLGTEVAFSCEVDLGSDRVQLTGSADRVERDPDGRIRIVDFKTSKTAPTAADVALHDQLGVYQLAVQQGAFAEVAGEGARPAGAELVYLRLPDGESGSSEDLPAGLAGRRAVPGRAARWRRSDAVSRPADLGARPARRGGADHSERTARRPDRAGCRYCPFRASCPAQPAGRQVVG